MVYAVGLLTLLVLSACSRSEPLAAAPQEAVEGLCGEPPAGALEHPCRIAPITFEPGESDLSAEERCRIEALAVCIRGERLGELMITAHVLRDGVRTEEEAIELSSRRADAVRRELQRLNIRCASYIIAGFAMGSASQVDMEWVRRNPEDCIQPLVPLCENPDVPGGFPPATECPPEVTDLPWGM